MSRCTDYNPQWLGMLDCYGVISIWERDNSGYLVQNNKHTGPIVAQIKSPNAFVVYANLMYLIDITPKGICNNLVPGKYCGDFQVNGQPKSYYYDRPEQVPTYLVIDTKTGDERFYANLKDAPVADRAIFERLLTR
ncbi:hypothetical protein XI03_11360 [Bradyrhizobium sp. CCBAU 65884]|nr:hypothetical protein [Bradyrhizobium sp. CCBAU 65884]